LHKRNAHKGNYPLDKLCKHSPGLLKYVVTNPSGINTIDFSNPKGVKALNKALLHYYYDVEFWDIPDGYLCPPVPGRADYIHHLADLLSKGNEVNIPKGKNVKGLDIGTGANLIYPIIATAQYGWKMIGTDIDKVSIASAEHIIKSNHRLRKNIEIRQQDKADFIFEGLIKPTDKFDFCMCNPPFHSSAKEAFNTASRKTKNLAKNKVKRQSTVSKSSTSSLNFAGQANELWCTGGELAFIIKMIDESVRYSHQIQWFTSLISKKENVNTLVNKLKKMDVKIDTVEMDIKIINMAQGNKISRFVAWRFVTIR
jgi:23S rRNA (adenine1618-N6)-methyltransferase